MKKLLVLLLASFVAFSCFAMESGEVTGTSTAQQTQQQPAVQQGGQQPPINQPMLVVLQNEKHEDMRDEKGNVIQFIVPYNVVQESGTLKHLYEDIDPVIVQAQVPVPIIHVTTPETFQQFLDIAQMMVNKQQAGIKEEEIKTAIINKHLKSLSLVELATLTKLISYLDVPLILSSCIEEWARRGEEDPEVLSDIARYLANPDLEDLIAAKIPYCEYIQEMFPEKIIPHRTLSTYSTVYSVAWSPDGSQLASGDRNNMIWIWDIKTGKSIVSMTTHLMRLIVWNPDGTQLASSERQGTISIWDSKTGKLLKTLRGDTGWMQSIFWDSNGNRIVAVGADEKIYVWDITTGMLLKAPILEGISAIDSVSWSPNNAQFVCGCRDSDDKPFIGIWNSTTGKLLKKLTDFRDDINLVSWSPDGTQIASAYERGPINIWDSKTGKLFKTLKSDTGWINSIAWRSDGAQLASGNWDKTIHIWDVKRGMLLKTLTGHAAQVNVVSWSPKGSQLASAGSDGTIRIWDLSSPIEAQCRHLTLAQIEPLLHYYHAWKKGKQFNWEAKENTRLLNIARSLPVDVQNLLQLPLEEEVPSKEMDELGED